jgi:hypothetical protein
VSSNRLGSPHAHRQNPRRTRQGQDAANRDGGKAWCGVRVVDWGHLEAVSRGARLSASWVCSPPRFRSGSILVNHAARATRDEMRCSTRAAVEQHARPQARRLFGGPWCLTSCPKLPGLTWKMDIHIKYQYCADLPSMIDAALQHRSATPKVRQA